MRGRLSLLLCLVACKAQLDGGGTISAGDDSPPPADADDPKQFEDAPPGLGPWGTPVMVPGASGGGSQDDATLSSDTLEMIFGAPAGDGNKHLYYMSRMSPTAPWSMPMLLPFNVVGTDQTEQTPRFTADDRTLYFSSARNGNQDIFVVTRPAAGSMTWSNPQVIAEANSAQVDKWFAPCTGGRYLLISERSGNPDVYEGVLGSQPPQLVMMMSTAESEIGAFISDDCRVAYWSSESTGDMRIYTATRPMANAAWGAPSPVTDFGPFAQGEDQEDPWISVDGRTFVLTNDEAGNKDVYISTR
jgi:Tol biopolymer transport system component